MSLGAAPASFDTPAWVLAHCDDGVTWGRLKSGGWHLGSAVFPDLSPQPSPTNLQEMRLFSRTHEVHIWRADGGFRGRIVRDDGPVVGDDPTCPVDETRILLGTRVLHQRNGFTRLGDGRGAEQAVPVELSQIDVSHPPVLRVRHYFTRDRQTGAVFVVLTRLVDLEVTS
jgi:CRISPR-associated protein (TIGR03984 family)